MIDDEIKNIINNYVNDRLRSYYYSYVEPLEVELENLRNENKILKQNCRNLEADNEEIRSRSRSILKKNEALRKRLGI